MTPGQSSNKAKTKTTKADPFNPFAAHETKIAKLKAEVTQLKADEKINFANFDKFVLEQGNAQQAAANREAQLSTQVNIAQEKQRKAEVALAEQVKDNNTLRELLFEANMSIAKMKGFQEGFEAAQPPRMVPEERIYRDPVSEYSQARYTGYGSQAKPWFHTK